MNKLITKNELREILIDLLNRLSKEDEDYEPNHDKKDRFSKIVNEVIDNNIH